MTANMKRMKLHAWKSWANMKQTVFKFPSSLGEVQHSVSPVQTNSGQSVPRPQRRTTKWSIVFCKLLQTWKTIRKLSMITPPSLLFWQRIKKALLWSCSTCLFYHLLLLAEETMALPPVMRLKGHSQTYTHQIPSRKSLNSSVFTNQMLKCCFCWSLLFSSDIGTRPSDKMCVSVWGLASAEKAGNGGKWIKWISLRINTLLQSFTSHRGPYNSYVYRWRKLSSFQFILAADFSWWIPCKLIPWTPLRLCHQLRVLACAFLWKAMSKSWGPTLCTQSTLDVCFKRVLKCVNEWPRMEIFWEQNVLKQLVFSFTDFPVVPVLALRQCGDDRAGELVEAHKDRTSFY